MPILWGVVFGVNPGRSPLAFWWLDPATVYALSLVVIAAVYIGFAVADGRRRSLPSSARRWIFVVLAAVGITGCVDPRRRLAVHGVKDFWQHRTHFVANTRWWPPFCLPSTSSSRPSSPSRSRPGSPPRLTVLNTGSWATERCVRRGRRRRRPPSRATPRLACVAKTALACRGRVTV